MPVKVVHAALEKMVSDGDYGREKAEASMTYELEDGEDPLVVLEVLQGQVRGRVEHDLLESVNLKVRRGAIRQVRRCTRCNEALPDEENSYMHAACRAAEEAEREARYQEQKARQEREWAERDARAGGLEVIDAEDDDDEAEAEAAEKEADEETVPF